MSNDTNQIISITGGAGFVGRHVVRELLSRRYAVRVLTRDAEKAAAVLPESDRLKVVVGDAFDAPAMDSLFDSADACINLIGIIRESRDGQTFERVHVDATERTIEACAREGVKRFIQVSALAADPEGSAAYQKSKYQGERAVMSSGLDWTIFRPGLVHGADGEFVGMMRAWAEGRAMPFAFMPYFSRIEQTGTPGPTNPPKLVDPIVAPVHVEDVAAIIADSIAAQVSIGEVYRLCGSENISFPDMLRYVRDTVPHGKKGMPALGLPGVVAAGKAIGAKYLGLSGLLPFDAGMALMGEKDAVCDNCKAAIHLGFEPRGFEESAKEYLSV